MIEVPIISIALFVFAGAIAYLFVFGFVWGAGYSPTPKKEILAAGELLDPKPGSIVYDLGSGFGRVVMTLGSKYRETRFVGVDIDPLKYWWSASEVKRRDLTRNVAIIRRNLLQVDLSDASGIFIFLSADTKIMTELQKKIARETRPGTRVVSYIHKFRSWTPTQERGNVRLYVV
ncbi:MAG TPA: class I SAM-dependent methyltransferase [Nitrososphaerales archaeon]|nr:class I SAM-dependent methyltransferase [Nitrososphaerales archaeon]